MISYAFKDSSDIRAIIFENGLEFFNMPTSLGDSICTMDEKIREIIEIEEELESGINDLILVTKWQKISNERYGHYWIKDSDKNEIKYNGHLTYEKVIMEYAKKYKKSLATSIPHGRYKTNQNELKETMNKNGIDFTFIFYGTLEGQKTENNTIERALSLFGKKLVITDGTKEASPGPEDGFIKISDDSGLVYGSMNNRMAFITMDIPHVIGKNEEYILNKIFDQVLSNVVDPTFFEKFKEIIISSIKLVKEDTKKVYDVFFENNKVKVKQLDNSIQNTINSIDTYQKELIKLNTQMNDLTNKMFFEQENGKITLDNFSKALKLFEEEKFLSVTNLQKMKSLEIIYKTKNNEVYKIIYNYQNNVVDIFDVITGYKLFKTNQVIQIEVTSLLGKTKFVEAFTLITNFLENKKIITEAKDIAEVIK